MLLAVLAAVALGSAAPGPGLPVDEPIGCTLVGCLGGVGVQLRHLPKIAKGNPVHATVCALGRCVSKPGPGGGPTVYYLVPYVEGNGRPFRVVVVLRDRHGTRIWRRERTTRLKAYYLNGPDCAPACWSVALAVDGEMLRVLPAT